MRALGRADVEREGGIEKRAAVVALVCFGLAAVVPGCLTKPQITEVVSASAALVACVVLGAVDGASIPMLVEDCGQDAATIVDILATAGQPVPDASTIAATQAYRIRATDAYRVAISVKAAASK